MDQEMITISRIEYEALLDTAMWLDALDAAGVDNWQGIDDAAEIYRELQKEAAN